jgi:hypothetical protein
MRKQYCCRLIVNFFDTLAAMLLFYIHLCLQHHLPSTLYFTFLLFVSLSPSSPLPRQITRNILFYSIPTKFVKIYLLSASRRLCIDIASKNLSVTITNLKNLAQHWEKLLFSTRGALNLQKSFWYLMHWQWPNGLS